MKPSWLIAGAALAAFLVWRRRRLEPTLMAGGLLGAAVMAVYGAGVVKLPDLETLLVDVGRRLGDWTYVLVGGLAFLETGAFVGLLAPGETAMLLGGLVAGQGHIAVTTLIGVVWACAVAGDLASFLLGRRLGRAFLVRHGPKVQITPQRLEQVDAFFERHGGKAILIGRFVGLVRAIAPFLAGSSGMSLRRFIPYDVVGAGLWGATFILLGYIFWQSFDRLLSYAKQGAVALGTAITLVVAVIWAVRWLRRAPNRARARRWLQRQAARPALRPVARVVRPVARVGSVPAAPPRERLTPGELGLEVTTLLAVMGVGAYTFVAHFVKLDDGRVPVGDDRTLRFVADMRVTGVVDVAKAVAPLGALPVAAGVVALASVVLLWRRQVLSALALVAGLALTYAGVNLATDAVDRPRPLNPLISVNGSSYPSRDAAYAVTWIAVAVALARALPGLASRFAFVTVGIVVAAVVGASRLYVGANFLSDITGGWGLGAALFALCGMVAVVVAHLRNNGRRPA